MKLLINIELNVTLGERSPTYFHKSDVVATEIVLHRFDEVDKEYAINKLEPIIKESLNKLIDAASTCAPKQLCFPGII